MKIVIINRGSAAGGVWCLLDSMLPLGSVLYRAARLLYWNLLSVFWQKTFTFPQVFVIKVFFYLQSAASL